MGCGCKGTPLQRVEIRITSVGWNRLMKSELAVVDSFIFQTLGVRPTTPEERISLYTQAKQV